MPRQFFIAPLVCTQTDMGTECAPKVNPQQVNFTAACQPHTAPNPQCLVLATGDTTSASNDNNLVSLVAENFDTPIASLPTSVRNRINNGLSAKGIPVRTGDYTIVRDFLTALGLFFDQNFSL